MPIHWLRCDDCYDLQVDVVLTLEQLAHLPSCPACGGPTHISWVHRRAPYDGTFKRMVVGQGKAIESRAELDRTLAAARMTHPGQEIVVDSDSPQRRKREAEAIRQRMYERRRHQGITDKDTVEHKEITNRRAAAAIQTALKDNQNPAPHVQRAAQDVGTLADAVGYSKRREGGEFRLPFVKTQTGK